MTDHPEQTPADSRGAAVRARRSPSWPVAAGVGAVVVVVLAVIFAVGGRGWFAASPGSAPDRSTPGFSPEPSRPDSPPITTTHRSSPKQSIPGLLPQGDYQPQDQQQAGECDGVPPVAPEDLRLLDPTATVTAAVVCRSDYADKPGDGRWLYRQVIDLPAGRIPALVEALTGPDLETVSGACDAMAVLVPDFVLTLADGSRVRPGLPGNGCHSTDAALSAVGSATGPVRTSIPVSQVASEQQVTSGCGAEAKSPAVWLDAAGGPQSPAAAPSADAVDGVLSSIGRVGVCRYAPQQEPALGTLTATGRVPSDAVADALRHLDATAPRGCPSPATVERSPATGWLMVQRLPGPDGEQRALMPLLLIEFDGCRRVVATGHGVVGYLPTASAAPLAALADQPAH
ncbi:MAG TPA: hypothetical protein VFM01_15965 [Nakamurella sp.]|nr:hypothetical protein [Nakamurella sp.]